MNTTTEYRIAAITPSAGVDVDALLAAFAAELRGQGWRIRGLLQETSACEEGCHEIALIDLDDGSRHPIMQALGKGSQSCRVDPTQVADASAIMRRVAAEGADLAIFNRFGSLEALGGGFAAEMLMLMTENIPVLTVVAAKHRDAWRNFTGEFSVELPADRTALAQWFAQLHAGQSQSA